MGVSVLPQTIRKVGQWQQQRVRHVAVITTPHSRTLLVLVILALLDGHFLSVPLGSIVP